MINWRTRAKSGLVLALVATAGMVADGLQPVSAQAYRTRDSAANALTGTFRLNTALSDNPTTVAEQATRTLPPRDRERFRNIVLRRLDAPEELAIERRGRTITLASSSADRVTFDANGRADVERMRNGREIRTTSTLSGDRLQISTLGDRANDYDVTFEPINGGRRLRVTRRVSNEGIGRQVTARSVYDRVSTDPRLDMYADSRDRFPRNRPSRARDSQDQFGGANGGVPDGTPIVATLDTALSTRDARAEDPFTLTVQSPSQFSGAQIDGRLLSVDRAGKVAGRADVTFDFDRIRLRNGRTYDFAGSLEQVRTTDGEVLRVENDGAVQDDESQTSRTATRTGIGAAIGAVIGAVTGGGKGAAIGAAVGAGAGAGSVIVQGRNDLNLQSGSEFTIRASGR